MVTINHIIAFTSHGILMVTLEMGRTPPNQTTQGKNKVTQSDIYSRYLV